MTSTSSIFRRDTRLTLALGVLMVTTARPALAQSFATPKYFLNVSVGSQPQSRTVTATTTPLIFQENASIVADHDISNGIFFDIGAGKRITGTLSVGATLTIFGSTGDASGVASIPDPVIFNHFSSSPIAGSDLKHHEQSLHLQATWFHPLTDKIDIAVSAGPSIVHVSQEFLSASQTSASTATAGTDEQSGAGVGINAGIDTTYRLSPRFGVGLLVRYTWGRVGLDAADITTGGFQVGGGLRARF